MLSSTLSVSWPLLFQATYILQSFGKLDNNGVGWRWNAVFLAKTQNTAIEGVYLGALSLFDVLKRGGMVGESVRNQFPVEHVFVFLSVLPEGLKAFASSLATCSLAMVLVANTTHADNKNFHAAPSLYFPQVY